MNHVTDRDRLSGAVGRCIGTDNRAQCSESCSTKDAAGSPAYVSAILEVRASNNFADALLHVQSGRRITRAGWNGAGQHVEVQNPDIKIRMTQPYLVLRNSQGSLVPWVPSQGDLFATDWALLP